MPPNDYCTIEFDASYGSLNYPNLQGDLGFNFYNNNNDPRIEFAWGSGPLRKIRDYGRKVESWEQYEYGNRSKDFGNYITFKYSYNNGQNPYNTFPLDPRLDCSLSQIFHWQNQDFDLNNVGILTLNLTIEKNNAIGNPVEITTPTVENTYGNPPITISNTFSQNQYYGATLKLAKGTNGQERKLMFIPYTSGNEGTDLNIATYGTLELEGSTNASERSHVYLNDYCDAVVEQLGTIPDG